MRLFIFIFMARLYPFAALCRFHTSPQDALIKSLSQEDRLRWIERMRSVDVEEIQSQ
jgi:hypothetical protein